MECRSINVYASTGELIEIPMGRIFRVTDGGDLIIHQDLNSEALMSFARGEWSTVERIFGEADSGEVPE